MQSCVWLIKRSHSILIPLCDVRSRRRVPCGDQEYYILIPWTISSARWEFLGSSGAMLNHFKRLHRKSFISVLIKAQSFVWVAKTLYLDSLHFISSVKISSIKSLPIIWWIVFLWPILFPLINENITVNLAGLHNLVVLIKAESSVWRSRILHLDSLHYFIRTVRIFWFFRSNVEGNQDVMTLAPRRNSAPW